VVPSDKTARSKGPARLGAPLPEDGNRAGFQNDTLLYKIRQWTKNCIVPGNSGHSLFSCLSTPEPVAMQALVWLQLIRCRTFQFGVARLGSVIYMQM
jgi:hypothetical protein